MYLLGSTDGEYVLSDGSYVFEFSPGEFSYEGSGGLSIGGAANYAFEPGYIGVEVDAYGTNAGFAAWLAAQGLSLPVGSLPIATLRAIGSGYVDAAYGWRLSCSQRTGGWAQELEWPRTGQSRNGQPIPPDLIPTGWIQASYRAAYLAAMTPGWTTRGSDPGRMTQRERVDVVERTFFAPGEAAGRGDIAPGMPFDALINSLVTPWLCSAGRDINNLFRVV